MNRFILEDRDIIILNGKSENANPYHVPAGSPNGGQFASKPGSVSGKELFYNKTLENKVEEFRKLSYEEQAMFIKEAFENVEVSDHLNKASLFQKVSLALGMNDKPEVISNNKFEKLSKTHDVYYRAFRENKANERVRIDISVKDIEKQIKYDDKTFQGSGGRLNSTDGTYFSKKREHALEYLKDFPDLDGMVVSMILKDDVKLADEGTLDFYGSNLADKISDKYKKAFGREADDRLRWAHESLASIALLSAGYDGVKTSEENQNICLFDRSKMILRKEDEFILKNKEQDEYDVYR